VKRIRSDKVDWTMKIVRLFYTSSSSLLTSDSMLIQTTDISGAIHDCISTASSTSLV
jgi:hypothetical protein